MGFDAHPVRSSQPEQFTEVIRCTGASTSDPTKNYGHGVAVARTAQGVWKVTFTDYPGNLVGFDFGFQATTASGVKGFTATLGDFDSTGKIVSVYLWDSTFAAVDLSTSQKLCLKFHFSRAYSGL